MQGIEREKTNIDIEAQIEAVEVYKNIQQQKMTHEEIVDYCEAMAREAQWLEVIKGYYLLGISHSNATLFAEAEGYFYRALACLENQPYAKWRAKVNTRLGILYHFQEKVEQALPFFEEAKRLEDEIEEEETIQLNQLFYHKRRRIESIENTVLEKEVAMMHKRICEHPNQYSACMWLEIGVTYSSFLIDYVRGIECFKEAMKAAEQTDAIQIRGRAQYYLGTVYQEYFQLYRKAITYFEALLSDPCYQNETEAVKCIARVAIVECYLELGEYTKAVAYRNELIAHMPGVEQLLRKSLGIMVTYLSCRIRLLEKGNYEEALSEALCAKDGYEKHQAFFGFCEFDYTISKTLGDVYLHMEAYDMSERWYREALPLARKYGKGLERVIYDRIAQAQKAKGA